MSEYSFNEHGGIGEFHIHKEHNSLQNIEEPNFGLERTVVYGVDIRKTNPPVKTLTDAKVVFCDSITRSHFAMTEKLFSEHLLLLGGIGCGKTNTVNLMLDSLIPSLNDNDIMIIFDTKGDFYKTFHKINNQNHIVIANSPEFSNISKGWNLFDDLRDDTGKFSSVSEINAKEIARELFKGRESSTQPFFSNAASDLVGKVLIHLMRRAVRDHTESELTTSTFLDFFNKNEGISLQEKIYKMVTHDNPDFASAQFYINAPGEKTSPQTLGVLAYITSMLNDLFVGVFANSMPNGSFSMRNLVRSKGRKVVFVEYDMRAGEVLGPMYRLMFDQALKEALGNQAGLNQSRGNTYVIIDEFKLLPDLSHIDDALNFGRSLGVKIIAGLQSINQLYQNYNEDRGKVIASGFMNTFCFQTLDTDSRKFICERFGETYEDISIHSTGHVIPAQRNGHVVEDWQILDLNVGEAFIKLFRYPPFKFQFEEYETH